jgi:hypothetical protein
LEMEGIEPPTFCMRNRRSATELHPLLIFDDFSKKIHHYNTQKYISTLTNPFSCQHLILRKPVLCSPPLSNSSHKPDASLIHTSTDNMSAPSIATKVDILILRLITTLLSYDEFAHFSKTVPAVVKSWDAHFLGLKVGVLICTNPTLITGIVTP